jgi:hypothetical protein
MGQKGEAIRTDASGAHEGGVNDEDRHNASLTMCAGIVECLVVVEA